LPQKGEFLANRWRFLVHSGRFSYPIKGDFLPNNGRFHTQQRAIACPIKGDFLPKKGDFLAQKGRFSCQQVALSCPYRAVSLSNKDDLLVSKRQFYLPQKERFLPPTRGVFFYPKGLFLCPIRTFFAHKELYASSYLKRQFSFPRLQNKCKYY